ncbi:MAG: peptidylprolyl isomerase [Bryobacterales bacterium]|nr:peptidylprolyl isomerase [Bryobacterales bacterium]
MRAFVVYLVTGLAAWAQAPPAAVPPKPAAPGLEPGLYGTMTTSKGVIRFELYEKAAPVSVKNFVDLCLGRKQWFDKAENKMVSRPLMPGVIFHRVIPGFMIQAGDPTGAGSGNPGFTIPDEFNPEYNFDRPGRFGMANVGRPDTNGSQFFITEVPTPHLNQRHTIFGQVIEGQEVVNEIARVPRNERDKPLEDVKILSVTFQRVGPVPPNAPEVAPVVKKAVPAQKKAAPVTRKAVPKKPATVTKK